MLDRPIRDKLDARCEVVLPESRDESLAGVWVEVGSNFQAIADRLRAWRIRFAAIHQKGEGSVGSVGVGILRQDRLDRNERVIRLVRILETEDALILALPAG